MAVHEPVSRGSEQWHGQAGPGRDEPELRDRPVGVRVDRSAKAVSATRGGTGGDMMLGYGRRSSPSSVQENGITSKGERNTRPRRAYFLRAAHMPTATTRTEATPTSRPPCRRRSVCNTGAAMQCRYRSRQRGSKPSPRPAARAGTRSVQARNPSPPGTGRNRAGRHTHQGRHRSARGRPSTSSESTRLRGRRHHRTSRQRLRHHTSALRDSRHS